MASHDDEHPHDHGGHDHGGHDHAAHDHGAHDHAGHDHGAHDHAGHDHAGHGHSHAHVAPGDTDGERRVLLMLLLQVGYMLVEVGGGLWTGSLALLADAGHMASDAVSLVLVLFAIRMARRPASPQHTFGHHRAEILAATANGSLLLAIAGGIVVEAAERMSHPAPVLGGPMMAVAAGGLVVNLLGLGIFASARNGNLNLRAAWLHVLSDALGSVGAMAAAGAVLGFGWTWTDPAVSCLIALLVVRGAWQLLQEALGVLMEGAPSHIDVAKVREALRSRPGVLDVHDLHVWTIGSGKVAMSGHIVTAHDCPSAPMLRVLRDELKDRFGISHATIQLEPPGFLEDDVHP